MSEFQKNSSCCLRCTKKHNPLVRAASCFVWIFWKYDLTIKKGRWSALFASVIIGSACCVCMQCANSNESLSFEIDIFSMSVPIVLSSTGICNFVRRRIFKCFVRLVGSCVRIMNFILTLSSSSLPPRRVRCFIFSSTNIECCKIYL